MNGRELIVDDNIITESELFFRSSESGRGLVSESPFAHRALHTLLEPEINAFLVKVMNARQSSDLFTVHVIFQAYHAP